jgi:hypothetical protein
MNETRNRIAHVVRHDAAKLTTSVSNSVNWLVVSSVQSSIRVNIRNLVENADEDMFHWVTNFCYWIDL